MPKPGLPLPDSYRETGKEGEAKGRYAKHNLHSAYSFTAFCSFFAAWFVWKKIF
jgi:hypothetical protein